MHATTSVQHESGATGRVPIVLLAALLLVLMIAAPAYAAWSVRESGSRECDYDDRVNTRLQAEEGHRHTIDGSVLQYGGFSYMWVSTDYDTNSPIWLATYKMENTSGAAWNNPGTYAWCG